MGSEKHVSSDSSNDQETKSPDRSKDGLGRSYECTFCKRGFTNAQALGGHMNIHRKDKSKAKQKINTFTTTTTTTTTASAKQRNKDYSIVSSSASFKLIPNEEAPYVGSGSGFQTGDHSYHYTPSNPNFPWNLAASQFNSRSPLLEEGLRVNLNLGIGTSELENGGIGSTNVGQDWFENDVDLELRLGQYP